MIANPSVSIETMSWLRKILGGDVAAIRPLPGGIASSVDVLTMVDGRRLVLRRWTRPGWREDEPVFGPENEIAALAAIAGTGLPVPRLVAADPDGEFCDFPALLMTWLPGTILSSATHVSADAEQLTPDMLRQLVDAANVLHTLDGRGLATFEPYTDLSLAKPPPQSGRPGLWEKGFEVLAAEGPPAPPVFVHRDYHPGNTLWRDGRLTGIVDWTNSSRGPAGYDFGYMRINLVIAYGQAMADLLLSFVDGHHPYWDLAAFLDMYWGNELAGPLDVLETFLESLLDG